MLDRIGNTAAQRTEQGAPRGGVEVTVLRVIALAGVYGVLDRGDQGGARQGVRAAHSELVPFELGSGGGNLGMFDSRHFGGFRSGRISAGEMARGYRVVRGFIRTSPARLLLHDEFC